MRRIVWTVLLTACAGGGDEGDTAGSSDWPETGVPWDASVSVLVDGEVFANGQAITGQTAPAGLVDAARTWSIAVTNRSTETVSLSTDPSAWIDSPGFTLEGVVGTLEPEQSATLTLSFDASDRSASGTVDATLWMPGTEVAHPLTLDVPPPLRTVVLGTGGYALVSDDYGASFPIEVPAENLAWPMRTVTWANGRFFRAGSDSTDWSSNGIYAWSEDGVTWTEADAADDFWVTDCTWAFARFLCLRSSVFTWSESGSSVIHEATDFGQMLNAIEPLPDRVVAVGRAGRRSWSLDGVSFTGSADFADGDELRDVRYANGVLVAVGGTDRQVVSTSTDLGETWSDQTLYTGQYAGLQAVFHGNGVWLASGNGTDVWTSTDGATWTSTGQDVDLVGFANGHFFGTRHDWNTDVDTLYRSTDGTAWTEVGAAPAGIGLADMAMEDWE